MKITRHYVRKVVVDGTKDQCADIFSKNMNNYSIARLAFVRNSAATNVKSGSDINTRLSGINIDDRSIVNRAGLKIKVMENRQRWKKNQRIICCPKCVCRLKNN